jgi:hypothetical protein
MRGVMNETSTLESVPGATVAALRPDPPMQDPVYRHLLASRDGCALRAALERAMEGRGVPPLESVRVLQCHYKPGSRGRLVVAVRAARTDERRLYLCLYADPERAYDKYRTALAAGPEASAPDAPILLPGWNGVGWWLPHAPNLEAIRFGFDRAGYRPFLADHGLPADTPLPELVRYVPRQRALFRAAPDLYVKCYRPPNDLRAADNLARVTRAWREGRLAFRPPLLRFHDAARHAVGMDAVAGRCFTEGVGHAAPELLQRVAAALASLHASGIDAPTRWTPAGEIAALHAAMADVTRALPALAGDIDALLGEIRRRAATLAFETQATVHGNLFGDQILVDAQHIGIVDWDDLALGDGLYDIGRLIAHLMHVHATGAIVPSVTARAVGELLHHYQRTSGTPIDSARLRWQIAVALLMRAKISALRTLPEGWIEQTVHAVAQARAVLGGGGPWLPPGA